MREAPTGQRRKIPCMGWSPAALASDVPPAEWSKVRAAGDPLYVNGAPVSGLGKGFELKRHETLPTPVHGPSTQPAFACPPLRSKVQLYWLARCCASWAWASARAASASASFCATSR